MKVISRDGEKVLVQFDNLIQRTGVVGVTAPIQAKIPMSMLAGLEEIRQLGQLSAQRFTQMMADVPNGIR